MRDEVVDFITRWSKRSGIPVGRFIGWIGISESKYHNWRQRYGQANQHNGWVPRTFWLEEWEQKAIQVSCRSHPDAGYRRLTYMMMDADVVAVSNYRILLANVMLTITPIRN